MAHHRFAVFTGLLWISVAPVTGADLAPDTDEKFRKAAMTGGDVERGKALFREQRTACTQCHSVDGSASGIGPDLYAAGDKFARADLVQSILDPSASIMTEMLKGQTITQAEALFERFHSMVTGSMGPDGGMDDFGKLAVFSGIKEYPARVKCATLAWHTLRNALLERDETAKTE